MDPLWKFSLAVGVAAVLLVVLQMKQAAEMRAQQEAEGRAAAERRAEEAERRTADQAAGRAAAEQQIGEMRFLHGERVQPAPPPMQLNTRLMNQLRERTQPGASKGDKLSKP